MTRKDYELIAGAISRMTTSHASCDPGTLRHVVHSLAVTLSQDNPRFDREGFIKACGVPR